MIEFKPIFLDNGVTQIHPLRQMDMERHDDLVNDLFEIYSDKETTRFIPEKRVSNQKEIVDRLFGVTIGYHRKESFTHFITLKEFNKTIGQIDIHSPIRIEQHYDVKGTWFIEYALNRQLWGHGVMSGAVGAVIQKLKTQGIIKIAAACMPDNLGSICILEKVGFIRTRKFDTKQDLYELK